MANINLSRAYQSVTFEGFGGIGSGADGGGVSTAFLKNFRIDQNGSLVKRAGYDPILTLPEGKLRAIHAVSESTVFALVGSGLYLIDPKLATCTLCKTLADIDSDACFFNYGDALYLIDGKEIYTYLNGEWVTAEGYVPLYGQNWDPSARGEVFEPINALSTRIRISYRVRNTTTTGIYIPYGIASLDAVYINGTSIALSNFSWKQSNLTLSVAKTLTTGDIVEVWFVPTVGYFKTPRTLAAAHTRAATFGSGTKGAEPSVLAFYGGEDPTEIFVSRHVDAEDFAHVQEVYTDAAPIYMLETDAIYLDDSNSGITATCRSGPHLAVFTEGSTYLLIENEDGYPKLLTISQSAGCTQRDAALALENAPVAASSRKILYWEPSVLYDNEYLPKCISKPIQDFLPESVDQGCVAYLRSKNELWFCFGNEDGVWVYNTELDAWYSFDGFSPDRLFTIGDEMAFVSGSTLYVFSADSLSDNGKPIEATVESGIIPFGPINRRKRLTRAILSFSPGDELTLKTKDAHGNEVVTPMRDTHGERLGYCEVRLPCLRSRYYSFSLSHTGVSNARVHSLTLTAVK